MVSPTTLSEIPFPTTDTTRVSKPELRVLQVFSVLGMGGAETWLIALLKYFREHHDELAVSVKFDILLTGGERSVFDDEAEAMGARLFYLPFTRRTLPSFVREFRRILETGNYDAIHDHQDYIAGIHFLMGAGRLPPVRIAHVHNPLYHRSQYANSFRRRMVTWSGSAALSRLATHVLGTSLQLVNEYGFNGSNNRGPVVRAAHCGFDVSRYLGNYRETHADLCREFRWTEPVQVLLFVGRLESDAVVHLGKEMTHKNPAFALEIARHCCAHVPSVRFLFVGSGDSKRRDCEARVDEWGLSSKIRFAGVRHDVPRLMMGSDLLLFPSLAEGLGMVVVEAQAAGLPVLASDTTPKECVVVDGLVTFMSLSESPEQWALEACRLSMTRGVNRANAAVKDSAFSIENSASKLVEIYSGAEALHDSARLGH